MERLINNQFFFAFTGLLPSLVWLFFFLKEDIHPEPKKTILLILMAGVLVSLPVAVFQFGWYKISNWLWPTAIWPLVLGSALSEEILKFLVVWWLIRNQRVFDEPIDAMIYMVTAALGFAAVENVLITLTSFNWQQISNVLSLRFVGATLLHALTAGLIGYYWAKNLIFRAASWLIFGLVLATLFHSVFNYLVLIFQENYLLYATLFLLTASFFVFNDFEKLKRAAY